MDKTSLEYYQKGKLKLDVILTNRCNLQAEHTPQFKAMFTAPITTLKPINKDVVKHI